jgi:hypothetical protein
LIEGSISSRVGRRLTTAERASSLRVSQPGTTRARLSSRDLVTIWRELLLALISRVSPAFSV